MADERLVLSQLESALRADSGRALMELMRKLVLQHSVEGDLVPFLAAAEQAGLINLAGGRIQLTAFGWKVGNALREYLQWEERGRQMPPHKAWAPALCEESFRDCDVLEIGSGFGCNLLSLQSVARSVVGVDIEPLYCELSGTLAAIAALPRPTVIRGHAENLPRPSESADIVLSIASIAYMRIERVLADVHRVLRPGGRAVIFTSTFSGFLRACIKEAVTLRNAKRIMRDASVALGAAAYPLCERLLLREFDPVCLPVFIMRSRINRAGLKVSDEDSRVKDGEVVYVAYKG